LPTKNANDNLVRRSNDSLFNQQPDCGIFMKTLFLMLAAAVVLSSSSALAQKMNADDLKWVNKCIDDNKGGAAPAIIRKYCMCMNEKMDDNETQSISTWEKSHPKERAACDKESGWK
jgi:hypothetical protein